jgi:hypothetical protein
VVVFSVSLRDCENVRQRCEPHPMNVTVGPNRSQIVYRIEARDPNRSFGFRYSFSWRPADAKEAQ